MTGECFRLDHLIKQHFEKIKSDKKTSQEEKETIERKITLLDGMTMVRMVFILGYYTGVKSRLDLAVAQIVHFSLFVNSEYISSNYWCIC